MQLATRYCGYSGGGTECECECVCVWACACACASGCVCACVLALEVSVGSRRYLADRCALQWRPPVPPLGTRFGHGPNGHLESDVARLTHACEQ